jgi:hypothetical protein
LLLYDFNQGYIFIYHKFSELQELSFGMNIVGFWAGLVNDLRLLSTIVRYVSMLRITGSTLLNGGTKPFLMSTPTYQ